MLEFSGIKRIYCTDDYLVDSEEPIKAEKVSFVYVHKRMPDGTETYIPMRSGER